MKAISSEKNAIVKHLTLLRKNAKYRNEHDSVLVSGWKVIKELSLKHPIKTLITTSASVSIKANQSLLVTAPILKKITGLDSPDGFAAEFAKPKIKAKKHDSILICDNLQDPGNLGTLFRTALAFDFDLVILLPGCVDPFNDKALRASKGATFSISHKHCTIKELQKLKNDFNMTLFMADMAGKPVNPCSFKSPFGIILGNEGHGGSEDLKKMSTLISVPMREDVDSLNVSICGSLLMYLSSSFYVR